MIKDKARTGFIGDGTSTYGGIGGLILPNDTMLEKVCRSLVAHGRDSIYTNIDDDDINDSIVLKQMIERRYSFERVGYSYRATELEAAIALSELNRWEDNIEKRRNNAKFLTNLLDDLRPDLQLPFIPAGFTHSFMMYSMVLSDKYERDLFLMHLENNGIETRYMFPLLNQPIYKRIV